MGVQPQFKRGKTYDGRRGRRRYHIQAITTTSLGKHTYDVVELPGEALRRIPEDKLLEIARLKKKAGEEVFLSASQFQTFQRCKRKWAFTYIDGEVSPGSAATEFGSEVHAVIEHYLKTGEWKGADDAVACAKQGAHMLPEPKDRTIGVEEQMLVSLSKKPSVKLIGYVDLIIPPRHGHFLKVVDHKSTKDFRYMAKPAELKDNVQATIYSTYAMDKHRVDKVETQWRYYCARPGPGVDGRPRTPRGFKVVSRMKDKGEVLEAWKPLVLASQEMVELALNQKTWAKDVEPNPDACGDYGGCPFWHLCNVKTFSIGSLMEHSKVAHLGGQNPGKEASMSTLMEIITRNQSKQNATAAKEAAQALPPDQSIPSTFPAPELPDLTPMPAPATSPLMAAANKALAVRQIEDGLQGINPPPVEEQELDPRIQGAMTPPVRQAWVDRYRKGHKARTPEEETWRAAQDALPEGQRTVVAKAEMKVTSEVPGAPIETEVLGEDLPAPTPVEPEAAPEPTPSVIPDNRCEITLEDDGADSEDDPLFRLYIDCAPVKGTDPAIPLATLLRPFKDHIQESKQVPHWNLLKYREGETLLAAYTETALRATKPDADVLVDSFSGEWKACGDVLMELADIVVRGGR